MQKSVFRQYFLVCASLVLCSILLLGLLFLWFISRFYEEDKNQLLISSSQRGASSVMVEYQRNGKLDVNQMHYFFYPMSQSINAIFFVTDTEGECLYCTELADCDHKEHILPQAILQAAKMQGSYTELGRLDGLYDQNFYTAAVPVTTLKGEAIAYVFASSYGSLQTDSFTGTTLRIFISAAILALLLTSVVVYFVSVRLARPLRQMAEAAGRFGQGDFTPRLPVNSSNEIGQLAVSLNNMAQSLSVAEATRRSFVANVSHELKTPLTSIGGFIDGILDGTVPQNEQRRYLTIVSEETGRMTRLVRTMLDLSRIEAGALELQKRRINLVDTVCRALFSFEHTIEKKGLSVEGLKHDKVMVDADPDLLHQVIYNLTENAVKFCNEGGALSFAFGQDGQNVSVTIRNTGAGLSKEELGRVFDRFYKSDQSRGLDKNGVGLGLYIVKTILNLHGGSITAESVGGDHCSFTVYLPQSKGPVFWKNAL